MKKNIKNNIFGFIIGVALCASIIGVYALNASEIEYKEATVESALDDLYQRSTYVPLTTTKGIEWDNKTFKSVLGENTINIGFIPSKLVIQRTDTGAVLIYDQIVSTTKFWKVTATNGIVQSDIDPTATSFSLMSVGSTTKFYTGTTDVDFVWYAIK